MYLHRLRSADCGFMTKGAADGRVQWGSAWNTEQTTGSRSDEATENCGTWRLVTFSGLESIDMIKPPIMKEKPPSIDDLPTKTFRYHFLGDFHGFSSQASVTPESKLLLPWWQIRYKASSSCFGDYRSTFVWELSGWVLCQKWWDVCMCVYVYTKHTYIYIYMCVCVYTNHLKPNVCSVSTGCPCICKPMFPSSSSLFWIRLSSTDISMFFGGPYPASQSLTIQYQWCLGKGMKHSLSYSAGRRFFVGPNLWYHQRFWCEQREQQGTGCPSHGLSQWFFSCLFLHKEGHFEVCPMT